MCRSLMMGMVPGMLNHLGLSQSADGKDTEYQDDRNKLEDGAVYLHLHSTQVCVSNPNGRPLGLSSWLPMGLCIL
jgi:hypothetical protein